ncbi:hypothetical protein MRX96_019158 [Rhipicephalus microplus]
MPRIHHCMDFPQDVPLDLSWTCPNEEQLRRHITIVDGRYTAVPEMRQASSTQENCSEQSRLRSEAERLWLTTSADSSATAQPSSSSGALLLHSAMVPAANGYAEWNATKHHADGKAFCDGRMHAVENRVDLPHPVSSSGAFHNAIPSPSRTGIGVPACGGSDVWVHNEGLNAEKERYELPKRQQRFPRWEQVGPVVVVEGALHDDLSTKALDGCSHPTALVEHASRQEKVAGSSFTTSNKWLASPPELMHLLAHPLLDNDQSSHDVQVANCLATYGANPPEETGGKKPEFAHAIPKLTLHEKYFLSLFLTFPTKDGRSGLGFCCCYTVTASFYRFVLDCIVLE